MTETHSKIAAALAHALIMKLPEGTFIPAFTARALASTIDDRLAKIREAYKPEELARCPIVSHHPDPCVGCLCAAMREFILLPSEL